MSEKLLDILNLGGNLKIIGSYNDYLDGKIKYPNDVDLQEFVFVKKSAGVSPQMDAYEMLANTLKKLKNDPNVYIVDIKAGKNSWGNALKWTYSEFLNNIQLALYLFSQKSIIKFDLVWVDPKGEFVEYSVNYYFEFEQDTFKNPKTYHTFSKQEVIDGILLDIQKLSQKGEDYKVLKRRYTLTKIMDDPDRVEQEKKLLSIINSPVGKLYQKKSKLCLMERLIEDKTQSGRPTKEMILHNLKMLGYDEELKTFPKILDFITEKKSELGVKIQEKLSELLSKEGKKKMHVGVKKKGGAKLQAALIKQLNHESDKTKDWDLSSYGYMTDFKLSTSKFQVYVKPPTSGEYGVVISNIRGTKTKKDVLVDVGLALNYRGERFLGAQEIQKKVVKKYGKGKYRLFIVGSSLGGSIAEWLGKKPELTEGFVSYDIITIGKPVTPVQLLTGDKPGDNQTDVRQEYDPISFLKPLQPHKNDVILESEHGPLDPIANHVGDSVMSHHKIKDELIGTARKLPVKNLRKVIIMLRKGSGKSVWGGVSYNVDGVKKKELQDMVEHLILNHKNIGDAIFRRTMEYVNEVFEEEKARRIKK